MAAAHGKEGGSTRNATSEGRLVGAFARALILRRKICADCAPTPGWRRRSGERSPRQRDRTFVQTDVPYYPQSPEYCGGSFRRDTGDWATALAATCQLRSDRTGRRLEQVLGCCRSAANHACFTRLLPPHPEFLINPEFLRYLLNVLNCVT